MERKNKVFAIILRGVKNFFTKNIMIKVVSLIFAMILWGYVLTNVNPSRTKIISDVPVVTTGVSDFNARNLVVRGDLSSILGSVDVRLTTDITHYFDVTSENISATVNLGTVTEAGVVSLPVVAESSIGNVVSTDPSYINVEIDVLDTKRIPIDVVYEGELPEGYWHSTPVLGREDIEISGPKTDVQNVVKAICVIPLSDQTESYNQTFDLQLLDDEGNVISSDIFKSSVTHSVTVSMDILPTKTVDISLDGAIMGESMIPDTYEITNTTIEPNSITVAAPQDVLDNINELYLESIDVSGRTKSFSEFAQIKLPTGVTSVDGINVVTFNIDIHEKNATLDLTEIPGGEVDIRNKNERLNYTLFAATLENAGVKALIEAPLSLIATIENEEMGINLYVDVAEFESATSRTTVELVPELIISEDSNLRQLSSTRTKQGEYVFILYRTDTDVMMQIKITLPIATIALRVS